MRACGIAMGVALIVLAGMAQAAVPKAEHTAAMERRVIQVCSEPVTVEVARRPEDRRRGLMFREDLPAGHGMLFVFERADYVAMWMKNVHFPIEIGFFDADGAFVNYHHAEAVPPGSPEAEGPGWELPRYRSEGRVQYVVEVNPGFFDRQSDLESCRLTPLPEH